MASDDARWNHNIHYHRLILESVPEDAKTALDIGCGEGVLARQLAEQVPDVTAIDGDEPSIELARRSDEGRGIHYVLGDVLTHPFAPASFDLVASVAALHHMETARGLRRMSELVRPGGRLVIVGLARSAGIRDLARDVAATVVNPFLVRKYGYWEHSAPTVWPPPETYTKTRRIAREQLPGVEYRRHLLWRYSLSWNRLAR